MPPPGGPWLLGAGKQRGGQYTAGQEQAAFEANSGGFWRSDGPRALVLFLGAFLGTLVLGWGLALWWDFVAPFPMAHMPI